MTATSYPSMQALSQQCCCRCCDKQALLLCCRYLISQHPEVEAKLTAELDKHGFLATLDNPTPAKMTYSDLNNLTYLSWVCKVCPGSSVP